MNEVIYKNAVELGFDVAEHTNAMLAYWDKNQVCRYANNAHFDWIGVKPEDMIDKMHLRQLLGPLYDTLSVHINASLAGKVQVFDREVTLRSGQTKTARATYFPDYVNGVVNGVYVQVVDVSPLPAEITETGDNETPNKVSSPPDDLAAVIQTLRSCLLTVFPGIPQLSKKHFVSESKLKRAFKEKFNTTIFSYYRHLQMEIAHAYLTEKKCNKGQMAAMLNFSNPSNFSACYQKYLKEHSANQLIREIRKENDERYQAFIEQSPMALAMVDTDLCFITASKKWIFEFNLQNTGFIGKCIFEMYDGFEPKYGEILNWCLQGNSKSCDEEFVERPDGSTAWMKWDIRPWYKSKNTVGGLLVLIENITEVKSKEDESKKISAILNKTSEMAHIGVWKRNFRTGTWICSKILKEILELPQDANPDLATDLSFYKEGPSRQIAHNMLNSAIEVGQQFEFEAEIATAKGNSKTIRVIGYPDFMNGKCEKISGIFQDISSYHTTH